jgi:alanine dehydrogenase
MGFDKAAAADPGLAEGINMAYGKVTNKPVAEAFGLPFEPYAPKKPR